MLLGDPTKCLGLVFGVALSTLLVCQQVSIFFGLLGRASSVVNDVREANVWVMDPSVKTIDVPYPLRETELAVGLVEFGDVDAHTAQHALAVGATDRKLGVPDLAVGDVTRQPQWPDPCHGFVAVHCLLVGLDQRLGGFEVHELAGRHTDE